MTTSHVRPTSGVVPPIPGSGPPEAPVWRARDPREEISRPGVAAELRQIVRDVWAFRELLYQLTLRDIRIRYKQSVMGFGWALFMPLLIVLSGLLVRLAMAQVSGKPLEPGAIAGMAVKAMPWAFFVGAIGFATPSLVSNANLVTKIAFPREVLPISATLAQCFDTLIGATALAVALPFLGVRPSLALVWVPLLALLLWCLTAAAGLILSCCNLFFRDVKYLVQVLLTFGIFFTPVLYEPQAFGARGATLLMLNPLSPILEGFRLAIVRGHNLLEPISTLSSAGDLVVTWSPFHLVYGAIWAIGALLISSLVFNRLESSFAENI